MKLNINVFYTSVLFILIVFCAIEYHNSNVLESRINSLNKNSISFNSEKTFKEDFYITQQSRDTTLLLVVFPILVGILSLFTYVNVTERHRNIIEEIKAEAHKQKSENDIYHNNLVLLESELNFQIGLIYSARAEKMLYSKFITIGIMLSFISMEKFALAILSENSKEKKEESFRLLKLELSRLNSIVKDSDLFRIDNLDFTLYKDRIARITKVLNNDETKIFNRITSKIEIT